MMRLVRRPGRLLPTLLWIALGGLLAAPSCAQSTEQEPGCDEGQTACEGACVDAQADAQHCGACGHACAEGEECVAGACLAACADGLSHCLGACVDFQTDEASCGSCNVACPQGTHCEAGACELGCDTGLTLCDGICADTLTDPEHCGACELACNPGAPCDGGVCQVCAPGEVECSPGQCADTQTSTQHCGGCGLACAPGNACVGGQCENPCGSGGGACGLCMVQSLGSTVPQTVNGSTIGALDVYAPSCSGSGSGERAYSFTAPADATYAFDTFGSSYDTALAVLGQGCNALGCNDDTQGAQSKVTASLAQGQTVYIVVDGAADEGSFTLHVAEAGPSGACDNTGFCGDSVSGCLGCALSGACADELAECQNDIDCLDYVTCLDPCLDQVCADACASDYPIGATIYNELVVCAFCIECYVDCDGANSGCL